jgi:hypothetical protein
VTTDAPRPMIATDPSERLCQAGLGLAALGGLLTTIPGFTGNNVVAERGFASLSLETVGFVAIGLVALAVFVTCAFVPVAWVRITGIGLMAPFAAIVGFLVIGARSDDIFRISSADITLGTGGVFLALAFFAATIGLVLALVGAPRVGRPPVLDAEGKPQAGTSGYAITSLVLSLCGLISGFTAPLGIAFAVAAFDDVKRGAPERKGHGLAVAGLVVGIVITAAAVLFMTILILAGEPSTFEE